MVSTALSKTYDDENPNATRSRTEPSGKPWVPRERLRHVLNRSRLCKGFKGRKIVLNGYPQSP